MSGCRHPRIAPKEPTNRIENASTPNHVRMPRKFRRDVAALRDFA
jgi:hypothetical protein